MTYKRAKEVHKEEIEALQKAEFYLQQNIIPEVAKSAYREASEMSGELGDMTWVYMLIGNIIQEFQGELQSRIKKLQEWDKEHGDEE